MYRLLLVLIAALTLLPLAPTLTGAQAPPTWVRGYPERETNGCVYYVAQWSDGSYTATPWDCGGGQAQQDGLTAARGYPQLAANGCTEYVTQWSDGSYTWVPFACPASVVYLKPGGASGASVSAAVNTTTPGGSAGAVATPVPSTPVPSTPPPAAPAPVAPSNNPTGATAVCRDGTLSYSQHRRGTCSHHGGVSQWLRDDIPS